MSLKGFSASAFEQARRNVESEMIQNTLKEHFDRISSAAAEFGISRPALYELMDKTGESRRRAPSFELPRHRTEKARYMKAMKVRAPRNIFVRRILIALVVTAIATGCSQEAKKARHFKRG